MSSTAVRMPSEVSPPRSAEPHSGSSGRSARRWLLIAAPVIAGLFAIVGGAADPAAGQDGRPLYEAYAADPDSLQVKAVGYHFAYAFWGFTALLIAGLVRARGVWIANVAGLLVLLGVTTMPGFILADFYDSAIGQLYGADGAVRVEQRMEGMWALIALAGTGAIGFILSLPVATLAAWRAGLIPWWASVAAIAGIVIGFGLVGATVAGNALLAVGFGVLSVALARIPAAVWGGPPEQTAA